MNICREVLATQSKVGLLGLLGPAWDFRSSVTSLPRTIMATSLQRHVGRVPTGTEPNRRKHLESLDESTPVYPRYTPNDVVR